MGRRGGTGRFHYGYISLYSKIKMKQAIECALKILEGTYDLDELNHWIKAAKWRRVAARKRYA